MAERKISTSSDSEDSCVEADALPLPPSSPGPEPFPSAEHEPLPPTDKKGQEKAPLPRPKEHKKKYVGAQGFDHPFFKNGFKDVFGAGMMSNKGQMYVTNINSAGNVHIGPNMNFSTQKSGCTKKPEKPKEPAKWVLPKHYFECSKPVTPDIVRETSPHIGMSWKPLGRELGFTDPELDAFEYDHGRAGLKEIVHQVLLAWHEENGKAACIGKLIEALWKTNCRHAEPMFKMWLKDVDL